MSENLSFLTGANSEYIAHLYSSYLKNPSSVDPSWKDFFITLNDREINVLRELHGASWTPPENRRDGNGFAVEPANSNSNTHGSSAGIAATGDVRAALQDAFVLHLVPFGHLTMGDAGGDGMRFCRIRSFSSDKGSGI